MTTPRRKRTAPAGTAVAYLRVSTAEQVESGAGLGAQRTAIQALADARGWTITAWHADEGVSGAKGVQARPGLAAALNEVNNRTAGALLVAKLDRLSRSVRDATNLIADAREQGWDLVAADGTVDMATPAGRFGTHVMVGVAELEREMISARTREGLATKRAEGVRLGRPSVLPTAVVQRIVDERAAGATLWAIANGLTADGTATARGLAGWKANSVRAVLHGQDAAALTRTPATA